MTPGKVVKYLKVSKRLSTFIYSKITKNYGMKKVQVIIFFIPTRF